MSIKNNKKISLDELDLGEIYNFIVKEKFIISLTTIIITTTAIIYSFTLPNIYQSKAIITSNDIYGEPSSALQSFSGIASLTGVELPSGSNKKKADIAIEKLNSLNFFEQNIIPNIFLPDLMALSGWNQEKNSLEYYNNLYDIESNIWTRKVNPPQKQIPSSQESFEVFHDKHFSIRVDEKKDIITLLVKHESPYLAKQWTELIFDQINLYYKEKDKLQATKAVNFLNTQIAETDLTEIKSVLASLLKVEMQKLTLIEANKYYVYDYIDPPAIMEKKLSPNRPLIMIIGLLIGFVLGFSISLIRYLSSNYKIN